jgi:hypothetical protein
MRRLVSLWLTLLAAFWLTRAVASWLLFGRIDQDYGTLVELLAIPALQALALGWLTRQPGPLDLALPWRQAWQLRALSGALVLDAVVVGAAWLVPASSWPFPLRFSPSGNHGALAGLAAPVGPTGLGALVALGATTKLLAAAALLGIALGRPGWRTRDRLAVGALGVTLPFLATAPWSGWPAALPALVAPLLSPAPRWFAAYGTLLAAALLLALQAATALRRHARAAALACEWALALLLMAAALAALGFARQPAAAAEPWNRAAAALASLSATALLVGAALAASRLRPAAARLDPIEAGPEPATFREVPVSHHREPADAQGTGHELGETGAAAGEAS